MPKKAVSFDKIFPEWKRAYPDERNEFLTDARALIGTMLRAPKETAADNKLWMREARKFMRETKP
jgi:hypothetical protein